MGSHHDGTDWMNHERERVSMRVHPEMQLCCRLVLAARLHRVLAQGGADGGPIIKGKVTHDPLMVASHSRYHHDRYNGLLIMIEPILIISGLTILIHDRYHHDCHCSRLWYFINVTTQSTFSSSRSVHGPRYLSSPPCATLK